MDKASYRVACPQLKKERKKSRLSSASAKRVHEEKTAFQQKVVESMLNLAGEKLDGAESKSKKMMGLPAEPK